MSREDLKNLRRSDVAEHGDPTARVPGASIWDPAPIRCPDDVCRAFRANKPLLFDGDYLSAFANEVLYQDFVSHISAVVGTP
jgi:hypothetical protein